MPAVQRQSTHGFSTHSNGVSETSTSNPKEKAVKKYSWDEIAKHRSDDDCWLVIKGKVYDMSSWVKHHPGGRLILNGSGREATALFKSYHPLYVEGLLPKYEIGEVDDYKPFYNWDSDFYPTLKSRVEKFLKEKGYTNNSPYMYFKTCFLFVIWALFYYIAMIKGNIWAAVPLGFIHSHWGITVSHDALHGAYSKYKLLNGLAGLTMDLMGGSGLIWMHQHNMGHHPNSNRKGDSSKNDFDFDPDAQSGAPMVRLAPNQPLLWYHRWQFLYIWLLFPFVTGKWAINDVKYLLRRKYGEIAFFDVRPLDFVIGLGTKAFFLFYVLCIPLFLHPAWKVFTILAIFMSTASYNFVMMFAVNHLTEDTIYPDETLQDRDWARLQALTSTNFSVGSELWTIISGGLNYQVEHHLFPSLCHVYLPSISPIVQETFKEFNVPYQQFPTFWSAISSYIRHLKDLGVHADGAKKEQ